MLSGAFIVATVPARCVKSASVAAALSRIAWAKAVHNGSCASVMPSCDCKVRIRWSAAARVAAEGAGDPAAGAAAGAGVAAEGAGEPAAGAAAGAGPEAAVGGIGATGAVDCATPIEGTSKAARAIPRRSVEVDISTLPELAQRPW